MKEFYSHLFRTERLSWKIRMSLCPGNESAVEISHVSYDQGSTWSYTTPYDQYSEIVGK